MTNTQGLNDFHLDLVGIGNAIVDVIIKTNDQFLESHSLEKGSMTLINELEANKLYNSIEANLETSGGSAANTLAGFAQLGGKSGFIGRVNNDKLGKTFGKDICKSGAIFSTPATTFGPPTARCLIFVTPDAQRTMCTFLGASVLLEPEDIDLSLVTKTKVLYLEGYLWDNVAAKRAFIAGAEACKGKGGKIALTLSDSFCVDRHRDSFLSLVEEYVDILFANEAEIISLYQVSDFESAVDKVKGSCGIAALTLGEKGSVILTKKQRFDISSYKFGPVIDTTGAGDLYASGFLYGYISNQTLLRCGQIGSICAGQIITQLGPRSKIPLKEVVNRNLDTTIT